jgi:hypothetical protein
LSSILKALKKIDESSPPDDNSPPWPHPEEARDAITRSIKKRWLIRRMTTYILVAACLISLTVLLYFRQADKASRARNADTQPEKITNQGQVHRAKTVKTAPSTASTPPVRKPLPGNTPPGLQRTPAPPTAEPSRPAAGRNQTRKPLPKKSMKAITKREPRTGGKAVRTSPPEPDTVKSSTASPAEKPTQYSRLQSTEMKLQAIAWAPEPSRRIAVVNGSIVKEGDSVAGYTLMRIRKDDIVLNDGRKSWQLEFGLQQ